MIEAKK